MLIIQPRSSEADFSCFNIWARTYLLTKKHDLVLMAMVMSNQFSGVSCNLSGSRPASTEIPALLTRLEGCQTLVTGE